MTKPRIIAAADMTPPLRKRAAYRGWTHRAETDTAAAWGTSEADALANLAAVTIRADEARKALSLSPSKGV